VSGSTFTWKTWTSCRLQCSNIGNKYRDQCHPLASNQLNSPSATLTEGEFDAAIAIELFAETAVHGGQGRLPFYVLARSPVESIVFDAVGEGGLDRVIRKRDQVEIGAR